MQQKDPTRNSQLAWLLTLIIDQLGPMINPGLAAQLGMCGDSCRQMTLACAMS